MSRDLGIVELLGAEAVGQPGQRRFRLFARSGQGSMIIWMEKEELNNLSLALDRLLAQITEGQVLRTEAQVDAPALPKGLPEDFPSEPDIECQAAQLRLSYSEDDTLFSLTAFPLEIVMEPGEEIQAHVRDDLAVTLAFSQRQAQELSSTISNVVIGGRPVCPLCHAPLDGRPHMCEKQNGHREIIQVLAEDEEEEDE